MKRWPLLDVYLTHAYYADRRCPDFQIEPTPETQRLLANYRCVMKPLSNGIRLLAAADDGAMFIQPSHSLRFAFQLVLRNPDFPLFTDLSGIDQAVTPLYVNERISTREPVSLKLVSRPSSTRRARSVFADVEITYGDSPPDLVSGPDKFQIEFEAKQARWKYYVVTDTASALRIAAQDKDAPLSFDDLKGSPKASDSIAAALAEQYPIARIQRFMSTSAIPCRQQPRTSLQLFADAALAVSSLPNPSPRNYTPDVESGGAPGEICLFQVVKFLTHLSSTSGG